MRGNLSRRGPSGVEQAGSGAMGRVALIAGQRRLERIADHRVDEAWRVIGRQDLETNEAGSQARGVRHLHTGDRRRVAQLAAVPEHGQHLRQAQCARIEVPHAGDHPPRDPLAPANQQLGRLELGQRPLIEPDRPQQLGQVERIAAARRPGRRAQRLARRVTERGADDRAGGAFAQQRRAHDRLRLRAQRQQRRAHRGRRSGPERDEQCQRQPLQPRREVGQPAQRGLVRPVRVIDGEQQWPAGCEVGGQPVQAVQNGKRRVIGRRLTELTEEQRPYRGGRPDEQRLALVRARVGEASLEQLPNHTERKVRLKLRPTGTQGLVATFFCPPARHLYQRRLANTCPALDHEDPAALQQHLNRGQLALALEQLLHETSFLSRDLPGAAVQISYCRGG